MKRKIINNSYWYFFIILVFNLIFWPGLTRVGYLVNPNDIGVLGFIEMALRISIWVTPLFIIIDYTQEHIKLYLSIFVIGTLLYFTSWILIIYLPNLAFTKTWFIQLAPAHLTIIWLTAIALMGKRSKWFLYLSIVFVVVHTISTYLKLGGTF